MIVLEDRGLEEAVSDGMMCYAVPAEVSLSGNGLSVTAYSFTKSACERYEKRYGGDPFGPEARRFLLRSVRGSMAEIGYVPSDEPFRMSVRMVFEGADGKKQEEAELISSLDGEEWEEELGLEEFVIDGSVPEDRMAVVRDNGRIVCFAGLNDTGDDGGDMEITVGCAESFRRHGYGSRCAGTLARHLASLGKRPVYVADEDNTASLRTAESAGFRRESRIMTVLFEAEDGTEEN